MIQPTVQQMETDATPPVITIPWVISLLQKVPIYLVAFACAYYLYQDNKSLNAQQISFMVEANAKTMTMVTKNGEMVMANTGALQKLTDQIEEGHRNLGLMDKTIFEINSMIRKIDQQTSK